jgi:hypothetical protein
MRESNELDGTYGCSSTPVWPARKEILLKIFRVGTSLAESLRAPKGCFVALSSNEKCNYFCVELAVCFTLQRGC